jgi:hypothetical protein
VSDPEEEQQVGSFQWFGYYNRISATLVAAACPKKAYLSGFYETAVEFKGIFLFFYS